MEETAFLATLIATSVTSVGTLIINIIQSIKSGHFVSSCFGKKVVEVEVNVDESMESSESSHDYWTEPWDSSSSSSSSSLTSSTDS